MDDLVLTEEEEKITHYCKDFCPLCYAIEEFNRTHLSSIFCSTEMCKKATNAFILDRRKREEIYGKESE